MSFFSGRFSSYRVNHRLLEKGICHFSVTSERLIDPRTFGPRIPGKVFEMH